MPQNFTTNDAFTKARLVVERIQQSLPTKIEASSLTSRSKLPFKALSVRETLIHRVSGLASPAISMFEGGNVVAGIVLTRSVLETVASTFALQRETKSFLLRKRVEAFDEFLMACLVGSRWPNAETPARSVLTFVDHVDKQFQGYRATYDSLCEYTHPNWSGVLGSFGSIDHEARVLHLGPNDRDAGFSIGVTSLAMSLGLFEYSYNEIAESMLALNEHFEGSSG
jgi:hypothetical protein